jgi:hypothetical protein
MRIALSIAAAVTLAFTTGPALAQTAHGPWEKYKPDTVPVFSLTYGDGNTPMSCAAGFLEPPSQTRVGGWILGYWSGLNVGQHAQVGHTMDTPALYAEVKLDCDKSPSTDLIDAVYHTWARMKALGR